ncbi:hypothetical protein AQ477_22880 [Burkholderia thailandensis]|nr:hypothetical protein AQ477_22880 [Burkholderia thailandensis]KXF58517.1 hypothetical protein AQ476_28015 [Burkholderia thailandensis]
MARRGHVSRRKPDAPRDGCRATRHGSGYSRAFPCAGIPLHVGRLRGRRRRHPERRRDRAALIRAVQPIDPAHRRIRAGPIGLLSTERTCRRAIVA